MSTSSNTTFEFNVNHNEEFKLNPITYQDGSVLNIHVLPMDFEDMVSYLKWKIPRRFTTLYYTLPPNNTLSDLSTLLIPNDGSLEESFAVWLAAPEYPGRIVINGKSEESLLIKTAHTISPISTRLSSTIESCLTHSYNFFPLTKSMAYSANEACRTIASKLQRELKAEVTLANQLLWNLTRYFKQMRSREIQMTMLQNMPTMSLNTYGLHALLITHEADIRTTNNLITSRQELLRSIAAKQNFINNYMAI
ncbi:hypothetical protein Tco_1540527 [Tanacetum coccineum]